MLFRSHGQQVATKDLFPKGLEGAVCIELGLRLKTEGADPLRLAGQGQRIGAGQIAGLPQGRKQARQGPETRPVAVVTQKKPLAAKTGHKCAEQSAHANALYSASRL